MFNPRHAPLKEGRSFPGLPYGGPSRRHLKSRQGAIVLLVLICIPLTYYLLWSGADAHRATPSRFATDPASQLAPNPEVVFRPSVNQAADERPGPPDDQPADPFQAAGPGNDRFEAPAETAPQTPQARPQGDRDDEEPVPPKDAAAGGKSSINVPKTQAKLGAEKIRFSERPKLERTLQRVINLMPGEMEGRDLLRPVDGTGKEKLREMGLRVREYKKFLDAWEELHLAVDDEGGSYVRDDVIQYLRYHQHQASADTLIEGEIAQTVHSYEAYRYFLVKFGQLLFPWTAPYFPDHMTLHAHFKRGGRGIVLTAGDDQAPFLLTIIPTFRRLGCTLPIEVMYLGDSDLSEDYRADLEALDGVITRDIAQMVNDDGWKLAGWAAKPFAILHSSFREVIFIDADSLFFTNPEVLFDDPIYQKTGALFFKDRLIMPENKKRWLQQILPKPISRQVKQSRFWTGDSGHMQESGVVVVDKWRHFVALLLVTRMNGPDRDGNKDEGRVGVYDMVYGDKETFWIGWELVGDLDYGFHQGDAGIMGTVQPPDMSDEDRKPARPRRKRPKQPVMNEIGVIGDPGDHEPRPDHDHDHDHQREGEGEGEEHAAPPEVHEPTSYTICAPQLLHLDLDGKPLWFNGWLLDNKFADKKQKKFGKFDHYLIEPRDVRDPGAWQLEESNMCCLTTDPPLKRDFSPEEKDILAMMIAQAREVGVTG